MEQKQAGASPSPIGGELLAWLREEARSLGIDQLACTPAAEVPEHRRYAAWLQAELHGEMDYLVRDAETRRDPRLLFAAAETVISVAVSYFHPEPAARDETHGLRGQIARYARAEDYHLVLKRRLGELGERLQRRLGGDVPLAYRVCVDSAPILERALGAQAGLGFIGKNTLLITPGIGSYTLLGEILVPLALPAGQAMAPRCGLCRLCLDRCPTGAIIDEYRVDARRCISYLTIENSGPIPRPFRRPMGTWIFGCDLCQEVCPWNAAERPGDPELAPHAGKSRPELLWLLGLGAAQFRRFVRRTALRRIGRSQLLRNVAVALGNVGTAAEVPALGAALGREGPLVRAHLAWALGEIATRDPAAREPARAVVEAALAAESDPDVGDELRAALVATAAPP